MAQAVSSNGQDIIIEYGGTIRKGKRVRKLRYNVSSFVRNYKSQIPDQRMANFITKVDSQVKVRINTEQHKTDKSIGDQEGAHEVDRLTNFEGERISELNEIVDIVCLQLSKLDYRCKDITKQLTGSLYADLKVGIPFEADYLLKLSQSSDPLSLLEFTKLMKTVWQDKDTLLKNENWKIYGITWHRAGVTMVMQYCHGNERQTGVLVDLVPVYEQPNEKQIVFTRVAINYIKKRS